MMKCLSNSFARADTDCCKRSSRAVLVLVNVSSFNVQREKIHSEHIRYITFNRIKVDSIN